MPPKKKPKKKPKKDPKTISQNVKQSVVIKIGDTTAKKKRTYTKRAHITPKKDAPIGPVNNPQPLLLQQRVEPVSRLDPSIEKLKMSANQFDDLSKQTNDLLQRISRTNLMQAQDQLKPPPVVESLIEQPFQTPAPPESKQRKITEFMTPFSNPLKLSPSTQTLNEAFESPVDPDVYSLEGMWPDETEQVSAPEISAGAGEEAITELAPGTEAGAELSTPKSTRGRPKGTTKEAIAEKRQGQAEEVATALLSNFPMETGLSSQSFSGDTPAPSVSGMQTPGTISALTMTPGILTPAPPGLTPSLNEVLTPAIKAPGMDRLLDASPSSASTATTAGLSSPSLAESTASTKKGAGRPAGSKGKTDEEKEAERATHRAEVERILNILRTNGKYVSGNRGPMSKAETAARLAYTNETTTATSKPKAKKK